MGDARFRENRLEEAAIIYRRVGVLLDYVLDWRGAGNLREQCKSNIGAVLLRQGQYGKFY